MDAQDVIGVVIVHYYRWPDTQETVRDAIAGGVRPSLIVVVDNGSSGGSPGAFREAYPECTWLEGHGNVGYAAAVNLGVEHVKGLGANHALVLTHEVRFDPELPSRLSSVLRSNPLVGAAAPRLRRLNNPDAVWSEGGEINLLTCLPKNRPTYDGSSPDWVDGCCFMVRVSDFERVGRMHEPYFLYMEEVDFFVHLRRAGLEIALLEDVFALQEPGTMSLYHATRNRILLSYRIGNILSRLFTVSETVARLVHGTLAHPHSGRDKQIERARAMRDGIQAGRASRRATLTGLSRRPGRI